MTLHDFHLLSSCRVYSPHLECKLDLVTCFSWIEYSKINRIHSYNWLQKIPTSAFLIFSLWLVSCVCSHRQGHLAKNWGWPSGPPLVRNRGLLTKSPESAEFCQQPYKWAWKQIHPQSSLQMTTTLVGNLRGTQSQNTQCPDSRPTETVR